MSGIFGADQPSPDACCGVTTCCTPGERAADPVTTVTEAKATSGCGCVG
jgi:hypothetical protein